MCLHSPWPRRSHDNQKTPLDVPPEGRGYVWPLVLHRCHAVMADQRNRTKFPVGPGGLLKIPPGSARLFLFARNSGVFSRNPTSDALQVLSLPGASLLGLLYVLKIGHLQVQVPREPPVGVAEGLPAHDYEVPAANRTPPPFPYSPRSPGATDKTPILVMAGGPPIPTSC